MLSEIVEKDYLYLFSHVPGVGAVTLHKIREVLGSYQKAWRMDPGKLERTGILKSNQLAALGYYCPSELEMHLPVPYPEVGIDDGED